MAHSRETPIRIRHNASRCSATVPRGYAQSTPRINVSGLDAGGGNHEVGREAQEDPGHEEPGDEHRVAVLAVDREQLLDDVEDRAARDREEDDRHGVARPGLPDNGAEERGASSDETEQAEQPPARDDSRAAQRPA